jgi:hypothetical protein
MVCTAKPLGTGGDRSYPLWYVAGEDRIKKVPRLRLCCKRSIFRSALGRTRTCDLLIRSLNTYVRGCSLVSQNPHI